MPRKRKPSGWGYLVRESRSFPEDRRGLAISTLGKVIRRGWDWLGVNPATPDRISGLIEIPALAEALTLDKSDFLRSGPRGALWLAHRRVLQEVIQRQLEAWGDQRDVSEERRRKVARPVERHAGGQRRLPVGEAAPSGVTWSAEAAKALSETPERTAPPRASDTAAEGASAPGLPEDPADEAARAPVTPLPLATSRKGARKPGRYGLHIAYENRPDSSDPARLTETTVLVNEAHPAYQRAAESRSEGYHLALCVSLALAPLASGVTQERRFIESFLEHWGRATHRPRRSLSNQTRR